MGQQIKADKWDFVLSEMYRTLKPGGYIEMFEPGTKLLIIGAFPLLMI
jgi:ubiquinone/menaquinone biosynthesis C-methylase UbiE